MVARPKREREGVEGSQPGREDGNVALDNLRLALDGCSLARLSQERMGAKDSRRTQ